MFHLLAIAPEDGWAFIRRGDEFLLVKSPYSEWALSRAEEEDLERSLGLHGFRAEDTRCAFAKAAAHGVPGLRAPYSGMM